MEEHVFLEEGGVKVTNTRLVIPGETYVLGGITSVKSKVQYPSKTGAFIFIVVGFLVWVGMSPRGAAGAIVAGSIFAAPGVFWLLMMRPSYLVSLTVSSGEVTAFKSKDKNFIDRVVSALNEAIIKRG